MMIWAFINLFLVGPFMLFMSRNPNPQLLFMIGVTLMFFSFLGLLPMFIGLFGKGAESVAPEIDSGRIKSKQQPTPSYSLNCARGQGDVANELQRYY